MMGLRSHSITLMTKIGRADILFDVINQKNNYFILTGGPGVGKTTRYIIQDLKHRSLGDEDLAAFIRR